MADPAIPTDVDPANPTTPVEAPPVPEPAPVPQTPESLTAAFKAGQVGLPTSQRVPVRLGDGRIGTVLGKDAQGVVDAGGSLLDDASYQAHLNEKRYGGLKGAAIAGAEGLGRGLSLGGTDYAAIGAAQLFGGDKAAEAARQHLEGYRSTNPIVATGSEVVGAALPAVASGGATVPEEAALLGARAAAEGASLARAGAEGASAVRTAVSAADAAKAARVAASAARAAEAARAAQETASAVDAASSAVASAAGRVRTAVGGAGIANTGIARAGEGAASLVRGALGEGGTGAAALGRKLAEKAAQGAVEGALYNEAATVDESVLGDHELNAEKLLAAAGHGALLGGGLTGSLEGLGSLSRSVLGRVAPHLEAQAEMQAWKSLSPLKKFTEEAEARMPGGAKGVGRVLLEEGVIPESLAGATPEMLAPRIEAAQQRVASELGQAMAETGAKVKVNDVIDSVDSVLVPLRKKAGFEPIVKAIEDYKSSLIEKLAPMVEHEGASLETRLVERKLANEETVSFFQKAAKDGGLGPDAGFTPEFAASNKLTIKPTGVYITEPVMTTAAKKVLERPTEVSVQALFEQRRALDDLVYKEVRSLDPKMRVEFMRDIRAKMADMEVTAIDKASKAAGSGISRAELKDLRRRYQALRIAGDAAETTTARMATNRNFSLSDNLHAITAAASGHIGLAPVAAIAHKLIRERGNAVAAYTLKKLAAFAGIERAAASVDRQIERGVAGFLKPGSRATVAVRPHGLKTARERIEAVARAVSDPDAHAAHVEQSVAELAQHAPNTARAFQRSALSATAYLASQIPSSAKHVVSPTPHIEQPRISDADAAKFNRQFDAVYQPATVLSDLSNGTVTKDQIDALRQTHPGILNQIVQHAQAQMADRKKVVPYEKRKRMSLALGLPLDPTMQSSFVTVMQGNYKAKGGGQGQSQNPAEVPSAPRRKLSDNIVTSHKLSGL